MEEDKEAAAGSEMARRFRESCHAIYAAHRFVVTVPEAPAGPAMVPAMSIYNDPFTDEVWMGRAHIEGARTLAQHLAEERAIDVWMLPRGSGLARRIHVDFEGLRALPLELDSTRDEVALEWVALKKARCSQATNVPFDDMPEIIRGLRPR
jgi:hypothetical protein